jgi:3-methyladenine DNA glycosylase AlkD
LKNHHRVAATKMTAAAVRQALAARASASRAIASARFFRTGPGEYGEGDRFLGVSVPSQREVARVFAALSLAECRALLKSPVHEHRLTAVLILIRQFERGDEPRRARIYRILLAARGALDNWDLVDTAAPRILGAYLLDHPDERVRFERFLRSPRLWERRIAVLSAGALVRVGQPDLLLAFAERTLTDPHDLMHKAVGWMLREVGKRDVATLRRFLDHHAAEMPRTMLRYAIERLAPAIRGAYLTAGRPNRSAL